MATIKELYERFQRLDTDQVINQSFDEQSGKYLDDTEKQMLAGFNNEGKKIGKYKNQKYAEKKNAMNPLPGLGNVDLRLTGDYQRYLFVQRSGDDLKVTSGDIKAGSLEKKYPGIYGLYGPYKIDFVLEHLKPSIHSKIEALTGLRFGT